MNITEIVPGAVLSDGVDTLIGRKVVALGVQTLDGPNHEGSRRVDDTIVRQRIG